MKIKTLLGEEVIVLPNKGDEKSQGGIIIPSTVKGVNPNLKSGVIVRKGTGTPWNDLSDLHVKDIVWYKQESGKPYSETTSDGRTVDYIILPYAEIIAKT